MNGLKFTFGSVYAVLILLLLLMMLKHCESPRPIPTPEPAPITQNPPTSDEERARTVGQMGDLKVTLLWDIEGDVDLHVTEPSGKHIWYQDKSPRGARGRLDTDNTQGGPGSAENIFWEEPQSGHYKMFLEYYHDRGEGPIPCRVLVFKHGELVDEYNVTVNYEKEQCSLPDIVVE